MTNDGKKALHTALTSGKVQAVGIAWYDEADYPEILRIMADADRLPRTYAEWRQSIGKAEKQIIDSGARTIRVQIKPQAFAAWCAIRNLQVDAKARTRFASEEAARQVGLA